MSYETPEDIIGGMLAGEEGMLDAALLLPDGDYEEFLELLENAVDHE